MTKMATMLVATVALALAAMLPASASAGHRHHHHVPPDNSGIDQYTEVIPGPGGNHSTGGGHGGHHPGGGGSSSAISPSVTRSLNSQGSAGQGAASLAAATAPN